MRQLLLQQKAVTSKSGHCQMKTRAEGHGTLSVIPPIYSDGWYAIHGWVGASAMADQEYYGINDTRGSGKAESNRLFCVSPSNACRYPY